MVLAIFPRGANDENTQRKVNSAANAIISKLADGQSVFYLDPHICQRCHYRSTELLWQCPHCHEWNSFVEERIAPAKEASAGGHALTLHYPLRPPRRGARWRVRLRGMFRRWRRSQRHLRLIPSLSASSVSVS